MPHTIFLQVRWASGINRPRLDTVTTTCLPLEKQNEKGETTAETPGSRYPSYNASLPLHITPWHTRIVPSWLILAAWGIGCGITGIQYIPLLCTE